MMNAKIAIAPLQSWLIKQGKCVGCGRTLRGGEIKRKGAMLLIKCSCRRIFIYDMEANAYRRALLEEIW